ncbi:disease resistance protein RGA5-like isoform X2 [Hordeum vulgare subsp. vulgare]|uniref:disease resistance protein RGA5-like isoform X2 n=1 Tax=Hordeum vulgare subsp. vulgare TaxID=112509 RepID=UPI001D1A47AC|nr:disease resistance protein RGA5-like isoform X2 [Hordeum vulgare subsp. vulgare]
MEPSPISASLGAMGSLARKLDDLLATRHRALRGSVTDEIEQLATDLRTLRGLLAKLSNAQGPPVAARHWMKDVRELSYDTADCADQFVRAVGRAKIHRAARRKIIPRLKIARLPERWKWRLWIAGRVSEFRSRAREATRRYWRYKLDDFASNPGYPGVGWELPAVLPDPGDLVGIQGPMDELHRRLIDGKEQLKVVPIVGVGGIGKTTLAQKLWSKLRGQFECRAFVRTAQKPDMRGIIRSILSQARPHQPPDRGEMHHLIRDLREYLRDKRYFIIIDDLWAISLWDVLSRAFPEGNCGSRIVTITETMEVALACCGFCPEHIFKMESLGEDDSEKLLLQRILVSGNQQFGNVLPQIKRSCGGLPLAIIVAASLLTIQPDKLEQLGCMQNSVGANHTMEGFIRQILNISFDSLPHYLKTCLLYLSTYPEGCLFLKGDLVKQWVAEGFICAKEGEDMEEVAGSYFGKLVSAGLIQAMGINYNYEVLSYSVHHMVLDLITYKSIEENFITVLDYSQTAIPVTDKVRRLSLHFGSATYATTPASIGLSEVRSLFFSGLFNCVPSFMVFKLLRVLVLHFWGDTGNTSFSLEGICELFWLRYLQVTCNVTVKLPDQIEPMKHLETLEINAEVCVVPPDIVRLSNLLHLRLGSGTNLPDGVGYMTSLRTLMYFDLGSSSEDNLWGLAELKNLRDLHLTYSLSLSSEHLKKKLIALGTSLGKLGDLKSFTLASAAAGTAILFDGSSSMYSTPVFLERLELLPPICVFSRFPKWIGQLHKLSVLKIAVRELLMNDIDSLTGLHSLTVLALCVQTAPERSIVFNDGAFPVLRYFKFRCIVLCMSFMSGAMRNLRRLKLHFNTHMGEKYGNMLAGVEHLLNLRDIAAHIGVTAEFDRKVIELAFKDAIRNHPRCPNFYVKWVDPVDEEYHPSEKQHQRQERVLSGEKHGVLEKAEATNKYADDRSSQNSDPPPSVASCSLKSESKASLETKVAESKASLGTKVAESKASQAIEVADSEAPQATEVAESEVSRAIKVAESEASQAIEIEESKASPANEIEESKASPTYLYKQRRITRFGDWDNSEDFPYVPRAPLRGRRPRNAHLCREPAPRLYTNPGRESIPRGPSINAAGSASPVQPDSPSKLKHRAAGMHTPERRALSEVHGSSRMNQSNQRHNEVAVPRFGDWDESNASSSESFTHIFSRVRDDKSSDNHRKEKKVQQTCPCCIL